MENACKSSHPTQARARNAQSLAELRVDLQHVRESLALLEQLCQIPGK